MPHSTGNAWWRASAAAFLADPNTRQPDEALSNGSRGRSNTPLHGGIEAPTLTEIEQETGSTPYRRSDRPRRIKGAWCRSATDGTVDPQGAARYAAQPPEKTGRITVLTVIEIPRGLLSDLRRVMGEQATPRSTEMIEYVDQPSRGSAPPRSWPGDDAIIERYLADKRVEYTQPIIREIDDSRLSADGLVVEVETPLERSSSESTSSAPTC